MKISRLLIKTNLLYWMSHKKRLITYSSVLMLGVAALFSAAALIRSNKENVMEYELRLLGDYDLIIYNQTEDIIENLMSLSDIESLGYYRELGYVTNEAEAHETKVACFDDEESENIYHMTCKAGHYPQAVNEVAIDSKEAKLLGIKPEVGEKICLKSYDLNKNDLFEEEYLISGIFDASNEHTYGGWVRFPSDVEVTEYDMPGVFISSEMKEKYQSKEVCVFLQSATDDKDTFFQEIQDVLSDGKSPLNIEMPSGRTFAYTYILGNEELIYDNYGDLTLENIKKAISDGNIIKDFYSGVLVPLFGMLIFVIAFISIYEIVNTIIKDKQETFALLTSMGIHKNTLGAWFFFDFFCVTILSVGIGLLLGTVIHSGMIAVLREFFEMQIDTCFHASVYTKAATTNPYCYAVCVSLLSFVFASTAPILKFLKYTPIELLQNSDINYKSYRVSKNRNTKSWKKILKARLNFFDLNVFAVSVISMSTIVFGFVYFQALAVLDIQREEVWSAEMNQYCCAPLSLTCNYLP